MKMTTFYFLRCEIVRRRRAQWRTLALLAAGSTLAALRLFSAVFG